jgi:hypothetical protein
MQEAHYEESAWLKELEAMAAEGVLEEFVRACVQPSPQSQQEHPKDDQSLKAAFWEIFMGTSPDWYKRAVVGAMILNIFVRIVIGAPACAWCVLLEFIGTLAMATHCCAQLKKPTLSFHTIAHKPAALTRRWALCLTGCVAHRSTATWRAYRDAGVCPGASASVASGARG